MPLLAGSSLAYCLFMLLCFGSEYGPNEWSKCPDQCTCYKAPLDGIIGDGAVSLICNQTTELVPFFDHFYFRKVNINTLVVNGEHYSSMTKSSNANPPFSIASLILENFALHQSDHLFEQFPNYSLKYLSIYHSTFTAGNVTFSWTAIDAFKNLEVINIANCHLQMLDQSFSFLALFKLRTLIISSSQLLHIYRDAFRSGKEHFQQLILSNNQLVSLEWLTAAPGQVLPKLWYLDLQSNRLKYLPDDLKHHLPALKVFNLAANHFVYFSFTSLEPWFNISEMILFSESSMNTLFFMEEMSWLVNLSKIPDIKANFLVHAFVSGFRYSCPGATTDSVEWTQFLIHCTDTYVMLPDRLVFSVNRKLVPFGGELAIAVNGTYVSADNFTFDLIEDYTTLARYGHFLSYELSNLDEEDKNTIRIQLFRGERLLRLVAMAGGDQADGIIGLLTDQVEAFLDDAKQQGKLVLLVLWNCHDLLDAGVEMADLNWLEVRLLRPLVSRLGAHSALIGIEINSGLAAEQVSDAGLSPSADCVQLRSRVTSTMDFLESTAIAVRRHFTGKPIGVSIPANCTLCLPLVAVSGCLPEVISFDFLTIISHIENVATEDYSYVNFERSIAKLSRLLTGFEKLGIFYVLEADSINFIDFRKLFAIVSLQKYATGVFAL